MIALQFFTTWFLTGGAVCLLLLAVTTYVRESSR